MKTGPVTYICLALAATAPAPALAVTATLSWDAAPASEMVTGWKLYYDRDQPGPPYDGTDATEGASPIDVPLSAIADSSAPSLEISGLESCVTYWFVATASNAAGESDFSSEVTKKVVAKPRDLAAVSEVPGQVLLTWAGTPDDDPGVIPGYQVFYDLDTSGEPYNAPGSPFAVAGVTEVNLTDLTTRATYYFVVDSVCDNFASSRSEEVSVEVINDYPDPPDMGPLPPTTTPPVDMGSPEPPKTETATDEGCACTTARSPRGALWSALLFLAVVLGRRRKPV